ncbi:hypothetical protein [Pseudanabaena yagii]|uniref:Uncharacterized protein n=1 Tax=Pseudanabaena yagii GIHE-NHR1 TaxID=2722753 RepID=A0ABX1M1M7_9CYAN|nr:hypothetical protein [Pseudanabaena yagii]NMF60819.1 hypothetical protein [Pseudanabaena yagii GIHE-NHR1]
MISHRTLTIQYKSNINKENFKLWRSLSNTAYYTESIPSHNSAIGLVLPFITSS